MMILKKIRPAANEHWLYEKLVYTTCESLGVTYLALSRASTDSRGQCVIVSMCDAVTARASAASGDIPGAFGDIPADLWGYPQVMFEDILGHSVAIS